MTKAKKEKPFDPNIYAHCRWCSKKAIKDSTHYRVFGLCFKCYNRYILGGGTKQC